jgi:hypothetical protein
LDLQVPFQPTITICELGASVIDAFEVDIDVVSLLWLIQLDIVVAKTGICETF